MASEESRIRSRRRILLLLSLLGLYGLQLVPVGAWLLRDRRPLMTDQSRNYRHCLKVVYLVDRPDIAFQSLALTPRARGVLARLTSPVTEYVGWVRAANVVTSYPPLPYFVPLPVMLLGGVDSDAVCFALGAFFLALGGWGTYCLGRRCGGEGVGFLGAALFLVFPYSHQLARSILLDLPLMALVACSLASLLATEGFLRRRASVLFGAWFGVGMLTKQIFPVYLLGAVLFEGIRVWRRRREEPDRFRNILLALLIAFLVAGFFHLPHLAHNVKQFLQVKGGGELEKDAGVGDWQAYLYYLVNLLQQAGVIPTVLFVFAVLPFLLRGGRNARVVGATYLVAYLFFSLFNNKDVRYTAPLLSIVAVVGSWALLSVFPRVIAVVMASVVFVVVQGLPLAPVFGVDMPEWTWRWETRLSDGQRHPFDIRVPAQRWNAQEGDWHIQELREAIQRHAGPVGKVRVGVVEPIPEIMGGFKVAEYPNHLARRYEGAQWLELKLDLDLEGTEDYVIQIEGYVLYRFFEEIYVANCAVWQRVSPNYRRLFIVDIPNHWRAIVWTRRVD